MLVASYIKYPLKFSFDAGTSRGVLKQKVSYLIRIENEETGCVGWGEAGPIPKLSPDDLPDFEDKIADFCAYFNDKKPLESNNDLYTFLHSIPSHLPSLRFAFETALVDLWHGAKRTLYENTFSTGVEGIDINGLVWMSDSDTMRKEVEAKIKQGYSCIKLKIGALDFEEEIKLLSSIREKYSSQQITLRVDANGAFSADDAMNKLERLAKLDIHSIEQPIKQGQWNHMRDLCKNSPIPIALDEELIGLFGEQRKKMLKFIQPQFIILKPTLLGGLTDTDQWVELARSLGIDWWITSALESNIGLNAIAQFTANYNTKTPQGLGTGQLYTNNIDSPLEIKNGKLWYTFGGSWKLPTLENATTITDK